MKAQITVQKHALQKDRIAAAQQNANSLSAAIMTKMTTFLRMDLQIKPIRFVIAKTAQMYCLSVHLWIRMTINRGKIRKCATYYV
ncbi:hypothetical protein A3D88_02095 [Candidatus Peribacteria bacterium RIFCSPHIGHO2_02_FULL_52_16]|nr:MAG: hypothetical protein A2706_02865 [Candidatus Peribacteria bacterium RIFCSPHIGHO2_01_FULL_51_35]OGJ61416.1 MAG: hypothetical protein A3D88_02095 [Candidatus Peribacteria bacterium RIFCSPHIGHO2_02_FULL_52_16]